MGGGDYGDGGLQGEVGRERRVGVNVKMRLVGRARVG